MSWYHEKLFFFVNTVLSSGLLWLGSLLTDGDVRWIYATGAASIMMSGSVGLALRKESDSVRILIARTCMGIVGGIFGTKVLLHSFSALHHIRSQTETDFMLLSGVASGVALVAHVFGYAIIKSADDSAQNVASRIVERLLILLRFKDPKP
jgi:hypothetical protein